MEFILGVINNGGGFYSTEMYFHEAKQLGADVQLPCINHSYELSSLYGENTLYMGFGLIHEMESRVVEHFLKEREQNGPFGDLPDFVDRCSISLEQLTLLIRAGAFRFSGKSKQELLWEMYNLMGTARKSRPERDLFRESRKVFQLPVLDEVEREDAFDQMELFGFSLYSPFDLLETDRLPPLKAGEVGSKVGQFIEIAGYLVAIKHTATSKGERMQFGTFIDRQGDWIDTVHLPPVARKFPFRGKGCYLIRGKVTKEFGFPSIETESMQRLEYLHRDKLKLAG